MTAVSWQTTNRSSFAHVKYWLGLITISAFFLHITFAFASPRDNNNLEDTLLSMIENSGLDSAHIGIFVEEAEGDSVLFQHNGSKRFISASNMKLYTSAAALLYLGKDFTYETALTTDGIIQNETLSGSLIIQASGDPTISGHFHDNNALYVFQLWARALSNNGVKEIIGDIIIDNGGFQDNSLGTGWISDDREKCFSSPRNAFSFNNNCLAITIEPGKTTLDEIHITLEPKTAYYAIENTIKIVEPGGTEDVNVSYTNDRRTISLTGTIPAGHEACVKYISLHEPAQLGAVVFKETLAASGISVRGNVYCTGDGCRLRKTLDPKASSGYKLLSIYESPPLSEMLKVVNKLSSNFYAEQIFLTIPEALGKKANSREATQAVKNILKENGIVTHDLYMTDGSGLSRYDLITPKETAELLKIMTGRASFIPFYNSLAIAGVDSLFKNRLKGTPVEGKIRAKTGTMTHVRNLSGYMSGSDGKRIAFSFLCNNFNVPSSVVDDLWIKLLMKIADYSNN